ncbi:GNAT family N-acetyltransferase [Peribacillus alkalitolerans]|uniref:GNAT family N-acetyltransferase n=1 Tax=Peribacillus alkalitolerans TaxID=1550385 RepID=UPI0013D28152|nr:GNAT family N-acetyltransferase [Peribacillus alkalitolerans]
MYIGLANPAFSDEIVSFLTSNLDSTHSGLYNLEFLCPDGVLASIRRNQMLVVVEKNEVIGAARFYPKKSTKTISLYQFAIRKDYRGNGLMEKMLKTLNIAPIQAMCPVESGFNEYYRKTGWVLDNVGEKFNLWIFDR